MTNHAENHTVPETVPTVSMQVVQILLLYARENEIDLEGIPLKVYLTRDNVEARLPVADFNQLWEEISERAEDPEFGLHFGEESFSYPVGNLLLSVLMNCRTLEDALHKLTRYHGLTTDYVLLQLQKGKEFSFLSWDPAWNEQVVSRPHAEAMMVSLRRLIHGLTAEKVAPTGVDFRHTRPADVSEHQRIFDCPVRFGQPSNRLLLKTEDLAYEILLASPALLQEFEKIAQGLLDELYTVDTWGKRVSRILSRQLIEGESASLEGVAAELAISPRGLQAKLHEENTSYRETLEELRKEMSLRYLARADVSIYEVAFLLGYSEQSAFTRAFKRWTGMQPRQYQQHTLAELG